MRIPDNYFQLFRGFFIYFLFFLVYNRASAQNQGYITEIGDIPVKIEFSNGVIFEKFGVQGDLLHPGYFPDPVGSRKNKVNSIILGGNIVRFKLTNEVNVSNYRSKLSWPQDYYFKVFNNKGIDITHSALKNIPTGLPIVVVDTTLRVNDYLFVDIFNTKTDTLIKSTYLKRIPVFPVLLTRQKNNKLLTKPDTTASIRFLFNSKGYGDSSLQYRLILRNDTSNWKPSGHHILLNYLKSNSTYEFEVRYSFQQESIKKYVLVVSPYWYQSIFFRITTWIIFVVIIFLAGRVIYFSRTRIAKQKQEKIKQQLQMIQSQLNPHFIFNSMSSIQGMINTDRIAEANKYLSDFSTLMRTVLQKNDRIYNRLDSEVSILDTYLKLEKLRFGFNYSIEILEDLINGDEIEIPVLLLQPLVENAVKHGVSGLKESGTIKISFFPEGDNLIAEISDNGTKKMKDSTVSGYGLKLTNDRIKLTNKMLNYKALELSFIHTCGTTARITLNEWLK